jgi:Arc/MetJ-type ribon-helix-helix transcriptional regulator
MLVPSPFTPEMDRWIDERERAEAFKDRDEALRQAVWLLSGTRSSMRRRSRG